MMKISVMKSKMNYKRKRMMKEHKSHRMMRMIKKMKMGAEREKAKERRIKMAKRRRKKIETNIIKVMTVFLVNLKKRRLDKNN